MHAARATNASREFQSIPKKTSATVNDEAKIESIFLLSIELHFK